MCCKQIEFFRKNAKFPQLLFTHRPGIVSDAISYLTNSTYSHVAIIWSNNLVFEAAGHKLVGAYPIYEYKKSDWSLLEYTGKLTRAELKQMTEILRQERGGKYDYQNVAGFVFNFILHHNSRRFCAELAHLPWVKIGKLLVPRKGLERITPELLYQSSLLKVVAKYTVKDDTLKIYP
jgi:hypothetical protein